MVAEKFENQPANDDRGFFGKLAGLRNRIPLRTVLIVPFVLQIFGTVALVEYFSFKNSQEAVSDIVSQLRSEISSRIDLHLRDYLEAPHLINQNNLKSYQINLIDINNQDSLARYFWKQKQVFDVNAVYFGNRRGGYVGAEPENKIAITRDFVSGNCLFCNSEDRGSKVGLPKLV